MANNTPTPTTMRERIAYFNALKGEGFSSHEAVAIAKDEGQLSKGDKAQWTAFYGCYENHEFKEMPQSA